VYSLMEKDLVVLRIHSPWFKWYRTTLITLILALLYSFSASAETIPYTQSRFQRGTFALSPEPAGALDLHPVHGGPGGKVWFQETDAGILIMGKDNIDRPEWARFPLEFRARDHVEVWLAGSKDVEMPEIGWGNQFEHANCKTYDVTKKRAGTEDCAVWEARQGAYRDQLRRLFVRQWQFAPGVSNEVFATEAYAKVLAYAADRERRLFSKLEPTGHPFMQSSNGVGYYSFQIFVQWSDFPPVSSLDLSRVYVAVEVFKGDALSSSTSPARRGGDPATFTQCDLARSFASHVTPCDYPLERANRNRDETAAWYLPSSDGLPSYVFNLVNERIGYRYDPAGLSPIPQWTHYFSRKLGDGSFACGPDLRYVTPNRSYDSNFSIVERPLSFHKLADGSYLLKSGAVLEPWSPYGSGQCGMCLTARVSVFHLNPAEGIGQVFKEELRIDPPNSVDLDIRFSRDWKSIVVYTASEEEATQKRVWSSQHYCWSDTSYEECDPSPPGPPPKPRHVDLSRPGW
jgi:hypothetical protein